MKERRGKKEERKWDGTFTPGRGEAEGKERFPHLGAPSPMGDQLGHKGSFGCSEESTATSLL